MDLSECHDSCPIINAEPTLNKPEGEGERQAGDKHAQDHGYFKPETARCAKLHLQLVKSFLVRYSYNNAAVYAYANLERLKKVYSLYLPHIYDEYASYYDFYDESIACSFPL